MKFETVNIKGTPYVMAKERIKFFRTSAVFKGWSLKTEMIYHTDEKVVFKTEAYDTKGTLRATGHAFEMKDSSFINKTSYIENCETSSVSRCLALLNIGIDNSVASYEEVANAKLNQNGQTKQTNPLQTISQNTVS
mgnify:FL=1